MAAAERKTVNRALARTRHPVGDVAPVKPRLIGNDSLQNFVAGMNTDRDKRHYSHYGIPRVLTRMELENMYRGSWIAKRIVNSIPDDMTKEWRRFKLGDDDKNPRLTDLENAEKELKLKHRFNEAMRWARLYGGCLIIMGIKGDNDLSKPLVPESLGKDCLQWVRVLDRWRVSPSGELDLDLTSPTYAMPQWYIVAESAVRIHASRVIRMNGQELPYFAWLQNARWDDPELQHILDSLTNNDTISSAIATMMFEANIDIVTSEGFADLIASAEGEKKIMQRYQLSALMKSFNRMLLLDGTEKYEKKGNSFTNLAEIWREAKVDVCGASEIPFARLFGQSPGGLSSTGEGDLENYYGNIGSKQEQELRPKLDQFDQVFVRHVLGSYPADYAYDFNELWVMSDKDNALLTYNRAQRDQIYMTGGVITPGLVASQLKQDGTYSSMSDEDVQMAVELGQPMNPDQQIEETTNRIIATGEAQDQVDSTANNNDELDPIKNPQNKKQAKKANGRAGEI